jgi:hypothetical protein
METNKQGTVAFQETTVNGKIRKTDEIWKRLGPKLNIRENFL